MRRLIVIISLGVLVLNSVHAEGEGRHIFVQAHRGYSSTYPELTLLAFERALEVCADRIEMDLSITADGHVVMMHDTTVNRTTDGSGRVESFTLEELKELDAGSWKNPAFAGERVPTLREVLELVDGQATLNLEVKSRDRVFTWVQRVVEEAVEVVQEYDAHDWVIFSSFDFRALEEVRRHDEDLRLLLIDWQAPAGFDGLDLAIAQDFFAWTPHRDYATEERIRRADEAGISIHVGGSPGHQLLEQVAWGVDGFSSGNPRALVELLEREGLRAFTCEAEREGDG